MDQEKPGTSKTFASPARRPGVRNSLAPPARRPRPQLIPTPIDDENENENEEFQFQCFNVSSKDPKKRTMITAPLPAPDTTPKPKPRVVQDSSSEDEGYFVGTGTNEWSERTKRAAENIQFEMQLKYTALDFGVESEEFRQVVNARSRGDPLPLPTKPNDGDWGPRPALNIGPNLARQLAAYTGEELKRDFLRAKNNVQKAIAVEEDEEMIARLATLDLSHLFQPIKIELPKVDVDKLQWNRDDDDDAAAGDKMNRYKENPFKDNSKK